MNIQECLSGVYSKGQIEAVANYACTNQKNFDILMQCYFSEDKRLAQMASWSVSYAARIQPTWIEPYLAQMVALLQRKDIHVAVIRNCVRILQDIAIPNELHGKVMHLCFEFIENPATANAVKVFSLTILHNLSKTYPEIQQELKLLIESLWDNETPAFKSRGKKILQQLNKKS